MDHNRKKNSKKTFFITGSVIFLSIILIIALLTQKNKTVYPKDIGIQINNNSYYLEIAQTNKQRKIGLSNRNEICSNCGMLFIFDKEDIYPLWMKDTYIPLDMIWINSQFQIVKIITALDIDNSENIYTNKDPAKYVIELPANEVYKLNLKVGDTIQLSEISEI